MKTGSLFATFLFFAVAAFAREPVDVLVQGAEKLEVAQIIAALDGGEKIAIGNFSFWTGRIGAHRVAVSLTGQALINVTTATVIGIEEFSPKLIVNQGTSGAQAPYLSLHDIIIGKRALDYGNYAMPQRASGAGSLPLEWTTIFQSVRERGTNDTRSEGALVEFREGFAGDAACIDVALRTRNPQGRVFSGVIGSAHEVNLELDRVKWTHDRFGMDVEEMESGHVAAVAHAYGVRYIAFRVVSDAPYDGVPFIALAARATGQFTVNFLHNLPAL